MKLARKSQQIPATLGFTGLNVQSLPWFKDLFLETIVRDMEKVDYFRPRLSLAEGEASVGMVAIESLVTLGLGLRFRVKAME